MIERGKDKFREISKKVNISMDEMIETLNNIGFYIKYNIKSDEELFIKLALEEVSSVTIKNLFTPSKTEDKSKKAEKKVAKSSSISIIIDGEDGVECYFAKCCMPVPGDQIVGVISRRGIGIHRTDCKNIEELTDSKKISVQWNEFGKSNFSAMLKIEVGKQGNNQ